MRVIIVIFGQVLAQGSGGCISKSFAEPAMRALSEVRRQRQERSEVSSKLIQDIDSVLRLLGGPCSLAVIDDDEGEHESVSEGSSDELEVI